MSADAWWCISEVNQKVDWQPRVGRAERFAAFPNELPASSATSWQTGCGSLKHRFDRWKTLVSARRANKVVPVRTKCRYIFYTRYRKHLQPRSSSLFCSLFVRLSSFRWALALTLSFLRCVFCRLLVCGLWSKLFVAPKTRTHYWIPLMPANVEHSSSHSQEEYCSEYST